MKQYEYLGYIITLLNGWYSTTVGTCYYQTNKMDKVIEFIDSRTSKLKAA